MNFPLGKPHSNKVIDGTYYHEQLSWAEQMRLRAWLAEHNLELHDVQNVYHEWDSGVATLPVYHTNKDGKKHLRFDCDIERRRTVENRNDVCQDIVQFKDKQ